MNEVARERAVSFLKPEHQARIEAAYAAYTDEPGFAKVATTDEIAAQGFSLSIPLYVKRTSAGSSTKEGDAPVTLREAWDAWESSGRTFWTQMDEVVDMLDGLVGNEAEVSRG